MSTFHLVYVSQTNLPLKTNEQRGTMAGTSQYRMRNEIVKQQKNARFNCILYMSPAFRKLILLPFDETANHRDMNVTERSKYSMGITKLC